MKIGAAFPTKYIKASDLNGQQVSLTIASVGMEDVSGDGEVKPVLHFQGAEQGFVLNKTNANTVVDVVGTDETDLWVGKQITLYPTQTEFSGKMVPCIRVQLAAPQATAAPIQQAAVAAQAPLGAQTQPAQQPVAAEPLNDEIPF